MPHRDQLESMQARLDRLERQLEDGEVDQARERARLERELAEARLELAKERERALSGGDEEDEDDDETSESAPLLRPESATPPKGFIRWFSLVLPLAIGGMIAAGYFASRPSFEGQITATGGDTDWVFTPTRCLSGDGQRPEFEGALLENGAGVRVRIERDAVQITRPGHDVLTLTQTVCSVFAVHVEWGDARVERVESIDGRARLDCELEDGTHVAGRVVFDTCAN